MDATVSTDVVKQLMEAGLLAASRGLDGLADRIFDGVAAARPTSPAPAIGRAMAAINAGRPADAAELLRASLKDDAESDVAKSLLGLALQMSGMNQQSEQVLREVVAANRNPQAVAMADAILHPADE